MLDSVLTECLMASTKPGLTLRSVALCGLGSLALLGRLCDSLESTLLHSTASQTVDLVQVSSFRQTATVITD